MKKEKIKHPKTLVVSDPAFFMRRDKRGHVTSPFQWSGAMFEEALKKWGLILIFVEAQMVASLSKFLERYEKSFKDRYKMIEYTFGPVEDMTSLWVTALTAHGATFRRAHNPREMTYLSLYRFMEGTHLHWVGPDDHKKIRISLDKAKTFQELQEERRRKAEW